MTGWTRGVIGGAVALGLCAAGCGRARAHQCTAVLGRIEAGEARLAAADQERLQRPAGGHVQTAQEMKKKAALYRELSQQLPGDDVTDKDLKFYGGDYAATLRSASDASAALAAALDNNRREEATTADAAIIKAEKDQKAARAKIESYCAKLRLFQGR